MPETVKKPVLEEDDKIAIGQKLGLICQKYPSTRALLDAQIKISLTIFEKASKTSTKGYLVDLEGIIERIDFAQNRIVLEGRRIKLGEIIHIAIPSELEQDDEYPESCDGRDAVDDWDGLVTRQGIPYEEPFSDRAYPPCDSDYDYGIYVDEFPDYEQEVVMERKAPPVPASRASRRAASRAFAYSR